MGAMDIGFFAFLYLAVPGLSCSIRDLVPHPGIEPGPPALGAWSLSPGLPGKSHAFNFLGHIHPIKTDSVQNR